MATHAGGSERTVPKPGNGHARARRHAWVALLAVIGLAWPAAIASAAPPTGQSGTAPPQPGPTVPGNPNAVPSAAGAPDFGPNVYVFSPTMPQTQIQATLNGIAAQQVSNQFGPQRYALFFEPGTYGSASDPLSFQVGYYTQVAGLGLSPGDVVINGSVDVYNQCFSATNCSALDNFWRSMSDLTINVMGGTGCRTRTEFWAVSQAAPLRRVQINGNVSLMDYCTAGPQYSSGGFISDSKFTGGTIINGSQQQFLTMNSQLDGWTNGVWNQVFSGDIGAPAQSFSANSGLPNGTAPYTTLPTSPVTEGVPFLYQDAHGRYAVFVPSVQSSSVGPSWTSTGISPGISLPLQNFFLAAPTTPVPVINAALARGENLILTPGVYDLSQTIDVTRPGTIVLGLGFATLIPEGGIVSMQVANVPGVKLSGMIFDAGPTNSPALLEVGCPGTGIPGGSAGPGPVMPQAACAGPAGLGPMMGGPIGSGPGPTLVQDVFFRIGGAEPGEATNSLIVNSSDVILQDIWAWRADHGAGVGWTDNVGNTGLIVNGQDVTAYGLFVEHYEKYDVIWNGQNGTDIFFQNEMPYDPPSQAAWMSGPTTDGYAAFLVGPTVTQFQGYGMGSYCYFDQGIPIESTTAFQVPNAPGVQLHDVFTRFLAGSGGIEHVVNSTGTAVNASSPGPSDIVEYP